MTAERARWRFAPRSIVGRLTQRLGERNLRVAMASGAGVFQRVVAMVGTFIMFPRVLQALGADGFGVWGAATSLGNFVLVADFGVGSAILTLVAHAFASNRAEEPREYFTAALVVACAVGLFVGCGGAITALCFAPAAQLPAYLLAIGGVAINVPLGSAQSAWLALQRGWVVAFWDLVQTLCLIAGLAIAVLTTYDVRLYVAVVFAALVFASGLNMTCLMLRHPELRPVSWSAPWRRLREVVGAGVRYFVLSAFDGFSYMLDNILALQILGAAASAQMAIVQRVCLAALGLLIVIAQPLWPAFVEAAARGDRRWMVSALARGSMLVTGAAVVGSVVMIVFGRPLLAFWLKRDIGIDQPMLWTMAFWIVSLSLARVQILLLNALQIMKFQMGLFAVSTTISFALKLLLAPRYGIVGILLGTAVTIPVIVLPAILWRIGRLKLDFALAGEGRPVAT